MGDKKQGAKRPEAASVFVEDWGAAYGSPYLVTPDEPAETTAELVEGGPEFRFHPGRAMLETQIAFVDGVRRGEASLYFADRVTGTIARGVAGAHACGAVIGNGGHRLGFASGART